MLIERVVLETGSRCFAANTDGASFVVKKTKLDQVFQIAREWEELTKLNLEHETYDKMFFRDVNNYIWVKDDKYKLKGVFEPLESKGWHKDFSQPIVNKAVVDYYTKGVSYKETIDNHPDILDFCKEVKVTGTDKLVSRRMSKGEIIENPENKLTRYYVSNSGVSLTKIMSPLDKVSDLDREKKKGQVNIFDYIPDVKINPKDREISIEAGHTCTVYNVHKGQDISQYDVNYDYYYNECKKLIKSIERGKTKKGKKNNEKSNSNSKYKQQSIF